MAEAPLEDSGSGLAPAGEGWFVVNARDAEWYTSPAFGAGCRFENLAEGFPQFGINLRVLQPGQPNGLYHSEGDQESFLVLSGRCTLLVDGEERHLGPWDFFQCPAGVEHIFVGAGDGPCVILMAGGRQNGGLFYPSSELANRHGAGAPQATEDPRQAYAQYQRPDRGRPPGWDHLPWA